MPHKDPQKRLAYNSEWRKKNKDKVLQYLQNQKSRKPIKFAKGIDKAHCVICGKEFIKTQVRHKYCTLQCQNKRRNQYPDGYRVKKYKTEDERKTAFKKVYINTGNMNLNFLNFTSVLSARVDPPKWSDELPS